MSKQSMHQVILHLKTPEPENEELLTIHTDCPQLRHLLSGESEGSKDSPPHPALEEILNEAEQSRSGRPYTAVRRVSRKEAVELLERILERPNGVERVRSIRLSQAAA